MPDFAKALNLVLLSEGGRVDDPRDPGGRTNKGITQRVYDAWRDGQHLARADVYTIASAEVSAIYRKQYADAVHFDGLPDGLGYATFDAAVNSGPATAARWLQEALAVAADGHIGVLTLAAAGKCNVPQTIGRLCDIRLGHLKTLGTWGTFGRGWTNRVESVRKAALAMTKPPAPVSPTVAGPHLIPKPAQPQGLFATIVAALAARFSRKA